MNRALIHMQALRAAAAATGRATKHLSAALATAGLLVAGGACAQQPTPTPLPPVADATSAPDAASTEAAIPWRTCATALEEAPQIIRWSIEPEGCDLCPRTERGAGEWYECCQTTFKTRSEATCAADTETKRCEEAMFTYLAEHCTPWGPPAPPRWTGARLDAEPLAVS